MARLSSSQYKQKFLASDVAIDIRNQLRLMEENVSFHTRTSYSPSSEEAITFTDKHLTYISEHSAVKPSEYLANLRLKTRVRG